MKSTIRTTKKALLSLMALAMTATALHAKTLVVYYSFTNNCRTIAYDVKSQLPDADLVEVQPAEEGLDYAANGYAIGSALISAIRNHPNDASSYPAIKELTVDFKQYDDIVVAAPLWWSNMAAPMQTFLFQNGSKMAGKKIGLIVSSASSGISDVEADAKRLIPEGIFTNSLWIRSSQVGNCHSMIASWIANTGIGTTTGLSSVNADNPTHISVNGRKLVVDGDFKTLAVYDTTGKLVLTSTAKETGLENLIPSVYVVRISNNSTTASHKFAIE